MGNAGSRLGFVECFAQFVGESGNVGFHENVFVGAGSEADFDAAFSEIAPAEVFFERTQQWLAARAQQDDLSIEWLIRMGIHGIEVYLPELQLVLWEMGRINHRFEINGARAGIGIAPDLRQDLRHKEVNFRAT